MVPACPGWHALVSAWRAGVYLRCWSVCLLWVYVHKCGSVVVIALLFVLSKAAHLGSLHIEQERLLPFTYDIHPAADASGRAALG